jgi:hypothetical protein
MGAFGGNSTPKAKNSCGARLRLVRPNNKIWSLCEFRDNLRTLTCPCTLRPQPPVSHRTLFCDCRNEVHVDPSFGYACSAKGGPQFEFFCNANQPRKMRLVRRSFLGWCAKLTMTHPNSLPLGRHRNLHSGGGGGGSGLKGRVGAPPTKITESFGR